MKKACSAVAASILASATAQAATISLPPNVILPNYDRTLIGQVQGLEGGAFAARAEGPAANWYNPAGLASSRRTQVSASSSAYEWTNLSADETGSGTSIGSTTSREPPGFFGLVIAEPIFTNDRMRAGFAISNAISWAPSLQSQISSTPSAGTTERFGYSIQDELSHYVPSLSVAYSARDDLRIGLSAAGSIVSYQSNDTVSNQTTTGASQANSVQTSRINGQAVNLLLSAGAQYDVSDRWKLGLLVRSPTLRLFGSAKLQYESLASSPGQSTNVSLYDPDATFRYTIPFNSSLGVAYVAPAFSLEADLRYHGALADETLLTSGATITTTSNTGGAPTTTTAPLSDVKNEFRSVLDGAIGAKVALSETVGMHAGFYAALSPVSDASARVFRKINLYGTTFGASVRIGSLSGSLGAVYETGRTDPFNVSTSIGGTPEQTTIKVSTLRILYALSFAF